MTAKWTVKEWMEASTNLEALAEVRAQQMLEMFSAKGFPPSSENFYALLACMYAQGFCDASGAESTTQLERHVNAYIRRCQQHYGDSDDDTTGHQVH